MLTSTYFLFTEGIEKTKLIPKAS